MLRILRSVWIWLASAIVILSWWPLLGAVRLFDRDPRRLKTARWFRRLGPALAKINPWRIHITGLENVDPSQAYVVVSNHQSMADIPVIAHLRLDTKWLGKYELFRVPVFGSMCRWAGDVPVDRSDRRKGAGAMLHCARYLRQGCSVVFFPEGTRSLDGQVRPFSEGPFLLAARERVPILPLVVEGSGAALPRDSWMFGETQEIHFRILKAVPVDGWDVKQSSLLRDAVRQLIVDELNRLRGASIPPVQT
jgi:1-acyl-sn-glycerol-3-phosphate acyltransferase